MIKLILLASLFSVSLYAQEETPLLTKKVDEDKPYDKTKSSWVFSLGAEGMKYDVPYKFTGARSKFSPNQQEFWGGRMGFGREFVIGNGFFTTSTVEGYYMGTLFSQVLNGGPDESSINFAYTKRRGQIFGVETAQKFGRKFDFKTKNPFMETWSHLTLEPFVEAGIGIASARNRIDYSYDTGTTPTSARERYMHIVEDNLTNARLGAGVAFTSSDGLFFFIKATANQYGLTKRKQKVYDQPSGQAAVTSEPTGRPTLDLITVYSLGGGYKF